ncbi:MAG: SET domain-containing protein-lysine N-methyltransferase [Verrucomicrobiae bacterium]|nr:SET domain-containing protein-lysine N-methyltransferase [Verrucomicrobiae bacterium]MCP5538633.1 SET domain-containing protein-lysine N-methyltransferase [Akkermansiaceae bacterium]MCP5550904.1 SET domain-containing protein-lysine N-methyltransferase [Akkermansiaceae bacterium]
MSKKTTATKNTPEPPRLRGGDDVCDSEWCEIRGSTIHGRGLFATKTIPEGERIIEYVGEKITKAESDRRGWAQMEHAKKTGEAAVYIFTLNKRHDLDGSVPWNAARLINHSCAPNCEAQIVRGRIWIVALRDIAAGEELFFNYGFDLESYEDHPCGCGTPKCVGYIAGEDYWKELKKLIRKKAKKERKKKKEKKKKKKK